MKVILLLSFFILSNNAFSQASELEKRVKKLEKSLQASMYRVKNLERELQNSKSFQKEGDDYVLSINNAKISLLADGTVSIEGSKISIKDDQTSSLIMQEGKAEMTAVNINIQGYGNTNIKGYADLNLQAGGTVNIDGSLVMVNKGHRPAASMGNKVISTGVEGYIMEGSHTFLIP